MNLTSSIFKRDLNVVSLSFQRSQMTFESLYLNQRLNELFYIRIILVKLWIWPTDSQFYLRPESFWANQVPVYASLSWNYLPFSMCDGGRVRLKNSRIVRIPFSSSGITLLWRIPIYYGELVTAFFGLRLSWKSWIFFPDDLRTCWLLCPSTKTWFS